MVTGEKSILLNPGTISNVFVKRHRLCLDKQQRDATDNYPMKTEVR